MMEKITEDGVKISTLVNVAGADIQKGLTEYTEEKLCFQCRVNFEAAVSLCRFAIANKSEKLEIVNVSSVSGIYPMPYFAIYSATKGALTSFSLALREDEKVQFYKELPDFVYPPVVAGERAGTLVICCGENEIKRIPLVW